MDLKSCVLSRTSTRIFKSTMISQDILFEIIDAARYAPSPKNRQPWRFLVLWGNDKDDIVKHHKNNLQNSIQENEYLMKNELDSVGDSFNIIHKAPVLILVFDAFPSQIVLPSYNADFDMMNIQAIGAAIENILLRATDFGIGSLWLGDILSEAEYIYQKYPKAGKLIAGISLGYPNSSNNYKKRLSLSEIIINYQGENHE